MLEHAIVLTGLDVCQLLCLCGSRLPAFPLLFGVYIRRESSVHTVAKVQARKNGSGGLPLLLRGGEQGFENVRLRLTHSVHICDS